jgi:hypothetical protein
MIVVGDPAECYGLEGLQFVDDIMSRRPHRVEGILHERPEVMPWLAEGYRLIAIYDRPEGEQAVVCETVEDVQRLWDDFDVCNLTRLAFHSINNEVGRSEA